MRNIYPSLDLAAFQLEVKKFEEQGIPCKGRFFRCLMTFYIANDGSYVEQTKMRPLKRMSCKGCKDCEHIDDGSQEMISMDIPLVLDNPVNGATYRLDIGNLGTDWETGIVDEWDYVFTLVK
jgi:hypothetical protein